MKRLAYLPQAALIALIAIRLNLNYAGLAVLIGAAIPLGSWIKDREAFATTTLGNALFLVGLVLLILAYLVCAHHGITLEALDSDRSFPRIVRRLPYFGLAFLTSGITAIVISICRSK